MEDLNLAIRPDFSLEDFLNARQQLTNDVVDDDQAARILGTLWDIQNTKDAVEELAEQQHCWQDKEEAACTEECKKNKTKYTPVPDVEVPSGPVNIPTPYATCKLKKGKYCELYFFTNAGLVEAESFNTSIDDEALMLLKSDNGQHVWVPASNARDKSAVIKDEDLTWEQFGEASNQHAPQILDSTRSPPVASLIP
ncbi:hypothetical protein EDD17DRAFT_1776021 [Pisolithus thermaeus]|nr:hypothetical protein EV401DRAFT_2059199 [Pisolithus croceorrhizus]KAI6163482.1 hypothetical protein EDD17DRAFT_1776021 [Pisolithus thermaeus]